MGEGGREGNRERERMQKIFLSLLAIFNSHFLVGAGKNLVK